MGASEKNKKLGQVKDEQKLIQRAYRRLLRSIKVEVNDEDRQMIRQAYEMAVQAHSQQRRKSGEPYILHPIEVARICAEEIGLGATAIICALLHDVVEDTDITLDKIRHIFGEQIAKIVDGLTKLDHSYNAESPQAANFRKVLSTLVEDVRVVLIKMADRLHNMRTLGAMPKHKQLKIAAETSYIYAPLAHRLGFYSIKTEYEDLCMKVTNPDEYQEIAQKLQESKKERNEYIKAFIAPLKEELSKMGCDFRIMGRPKSIFSIWNKIRKKKVAFEEIYDLFAIRIILDAGDNDDERALCWKAYSVVANVHQPIPERLKDWITTPKSNGYESLHTTVVGPKGRNVEVQIRTERMDDIAERGFAAHWKYKKTTGKKKDVFGQWLNQVRAILESQDTDTDAVTFLDDFKSSLFKDEVYVWTPAGEMKILPEGASGLDFAFHIHSDLGYHCQAVKINGAVRPLGYPLQNGDRVEILTSKNQKPNKSWQKLVVTGKAKSKIRSAMKEERRKKGEFGKEELERKLRNLKVDFEENIDMLVKHFGYNSRPDLFFAISTGQINLQELKEFDVHGNKLIEKEENEPLPGPAKDAPILPPPPSEKKGKGKHKAPRLMINGQPAEQMEYSLAQCCNPVQGDEVFAFITSNKGMTIHRADCPNGLNLMAQYGYRILKAEWVMSGDASFVAELIITGVDEGPGVISRLSNEIYNNLGLNIRSFYIDGGDEGYFEGRINLIVSNTNQLNRAIQVLKQIPMVYSVVRGKSHLE